MAMLLVDGVAVKTPSAFEWGLQDISGGDSGRTQDALMHKNRISQKRKLSLSWNNPSKEEASTILRCFNSEYVNVSYPDALNGVDETRTFYVGDRSAPMKMWTVNQKRFSTISFELMER